jgi:hypothetical protein
LGEEGATEETPLCKRWARGQECKQRRCPLRHKVLNATDEARVARATSQRLRDIDTMGQHGDDAHKSKRHSEFVDFCVKTFGAETLRAGGALDVGGGRGAVSFELFCRRGIPCTLLEPRDHGGRLKSHERRFLKKKQQQGEACSGMYPVVRAWLDDAFERTPDGAALLSRPITLLGLHPDEATEPIVDFSLRHGCSFAIVPCCVFPDRFAPRFLRDGTTRVRSYEDFCTYLQQKAPRGVVESGRLPFSGRNKVLFYKAAARGRLPVGGPIGGNLPLSAMEQEGCSPCSVDDDGEELVGTAVGPDGAAKAAQQRQEQQQQQEPQEEGGGDDDDDDGDASALAALPLELRRVFAENADPQSITPDRLSSMLPLLGIPVGTELSRRSDVLRRPNALDARACAALRAAVDARRGTERDTVDGAPDHQLNLSTAELSDLVGAEAVSRLVSLGAEFDDARATAVGGRVARAARQLPVVEIFARRYAADERRWFPLHQDRATLTVNVSLSDASSHLGGQLLGVFADGLGTLARAEGEATVHASTLVHGVTRLTHGARYSLILFLGEALPVRRQLVRIDGPDGPMDVWTRTVVDDGYT